MAEDRPLRVVHVITTLDVGGAEILLRNVLASRDRDATAVEVVSLAVPGPLADDLTALGVPVRSLGAKGLVGLPRAVWRLSRWLRNPRPDVVQTWMYHADFVGGLAARLARVPVVWGLHASDLPAGGIRSRTRLLIRLNARLSGWLPARIVCSAESTRREHVSLGYPEERMIVVPNGVEVRPVDAAGGHRVRTELELAADTPVVARVARFHRQKDYRSFVEAARLVADEHRDAHFVLCGEGVTWENPQLAAWIREAGLSERFHLLGLRHDVPAIHAAADVAVSSSAFGETTPLVVAEAMMQTCVPVVTDVGDSAVIVGETGRVVPPSQPEQLGLAIAELLDVPRSDRARFGVAARERAIELFSVERSAHAYAEVHAAVAERWPRGQAMKVRLPLRRRLAAATRRRLHAQGYALIGARGPGRLHDYRLERISSSPSLPEAIASVTWLDLDDIVVPTGLSYADPASIPLVRACELLLEGSGARARDALAEHYAGEQPASVSDVLFGPDRQVAPLEAWPARLGFLCWGIWLLKPALVRHILANEDWWSGHVGWAARHYYGPHEDRDTDRQVRRLARVLESFQRYGYRPEAFRDGLVLGYYLATDEEYRFVAIEGHHRLAALAATGQRRAACGLFPSHMPVLTRETVADYAARRGVLPPEVAVEVFDALFHAGRARGG